MRLQDILAAVPGLEKRFVHYLESQGYIAPEKLQKARIARRDYSEGDLDRIRGIWRYYQRGISIARAYELVAREPATWAYVLLPVPTRSWQAALDHLSLSDKVREAGIIYAETADVIARLRVTHESDVHDVLDRLFEDGLVAGVPRVYRYAQAFPGRHLTPPNRPEERMKAWILIKVPAKQIGPLVEDELLRPVEREQAVDHEGLASAEMEMLGDEGPRVAPRVEDVDAEELHARVGARGGGERGLRIGAVHEDILDRHLERLGHLEVGSQATAVEDRAAEAGAQGEDEFESDPGDDSCAVHLGVIEDAHGIAE